MDYQQNPTKKMNDCIVRLLILVITVSPKQFFEKTANLLSNSF